jgi:hypothetical protein
MTNDRCLHKRWRREANSERSRAIRWWQSCTKNKIRWWDEAQCIPLRAETYHETKKLTLPDSRVWSFKENLLQKRAALILKADENFPGWVSTLRMPQKKSRKSHKIWSTLKMLLPSDAQTWKSPSLKSTASKSALADKNTKLCLSCWDQWTQNWGGKYEYENLNFRKY